MEMLADSADLSDSQKESVVRAATELSGDELTRCLEVLKTSDLRYSLVTDLIAFGQSDQNYSAEEKQNVEKIAAYLDINKEQFSLLDQFVDKTQDVQAEPEEVSSPGFLKSLGLEEKFKNAGIDWRTIGKGLQGIAGPLMLAKMMSGRRGGNQMAGLGGGGGMGSMLGGGLLGGGLGSLLGGGRNSSGGGIGSLISGLSGGRGFGNSGGLLSRILGGLRR